MARALARTTRVARGTMGTMMAAITRRRPGAQRGDHRDRQDDQREGEQDVGQPLHDEVHPAAEVRRPDRADRGAERRADERRDQPHQQGRPGPEDHAAQDVAAEVVRFRGWARLGGLTTLRVVRLQRIVGGQPRREDGGDHHGQEHPRPERAERVRAQGAAPPSSPSRPLLTLSPRGERAG